MHRPIEINFNRARLNRTIVLAVLAIALGIWLVFFPPEAEFDIPMVDLVIGIVRIFVGVIAVGAILGLIMVTKRIKDPSPGLVISDSSITNNTGTRKDEIPWAWVSGIRIGQISNNSVIVIMLKDPQAYISRFTSSFQRQTMNYKVERVGSPVIIMVKQLDRNINEIAEVLEKKFQEYTAKNPTA